MGTTPPCLILSWYDDCASQIYLIISCCCCFFHLLLHLFSSSSSRQCSIIFNYFYLLSSLLQIIPYCNNNNNYYILLLYYFISFYLPIQVTKYHPKSRNPQLSLRSPVTLMWTLVPPIESSRALTIHHNNNRLGRCCSRAKNTHTPLWSQDSDFHHHFSATVATVLQRSLRCLVHFTPWSIGMIL